MKPISASLRAKILLITCVTVIGALVVSGIATYFIVRNSMLSAAVQSIDAIAGGNANAIGRWAADKARAVKATSDIVRKNDPDGYVRLMGTTNDFPITTVGWEDKSYSSTAPTAADYDPTSRPWYKTAVASKGVRVTKPYGDSTTGTPYVAFVTALIEDKKVVGALSGAVPLDEVQSVIATIRPTPSSFAFVTGKDGQIIAHPDGKFALKASTEIAKDLTPAVLQRIAVEDAMPAELQLSGSLKLIKARPVPNTDWFLVVALDRAEITEGLSKVRDAAIISLVILTLVAVCITGAVMSRALRRLLTVRDAMNTIGSGGSDISQRLNEDGEDEITHISKSFNLFVAKISEVVRRVRSGVASMSTSTREVTASNIDLSRRTEAAAASLQGTASALTQLTTSVQHTTAAAENAKRCAEDANTVAEEGAKVVVEAMNAMNAIAQSSERITEIIGVIDGIAFQTNILALNAAVEAARAGEEGRGFAVVAAEVRSLAQRSATAAQEIKALIEDSVGNVKGGGERVQAAGTTMQRVSAGIAQVRQLIIEIHDALAEQSAGISQIDRTVHELDQTTQQNAAQVEQSAVALAMLSEQATQLAETVGLFKLHGEDQSTSNKGGTPKVPLQLAY